MDIYAAITDRIILAMEQGAGDFRMPWTRGGAGQVPKNATTGNYYQGINIINLWVEQQLRGFSHNLWASYQQWGEAGAQVRKGEKASVIVFYKQYSKENDDGEEETRRALKWYSVFNANQVEGYQVPALVDKPPLERLADVDAFVIQTGAKVIEGGDRACYVPSLDHIRMPDGERFTETEAFYATLMHELGHWTGHADRLARDLTGRFKSEAYAMEELVAELCAAFLCSQLGISPEPRPDHAQYLTSWLKVLKEDKKAIFAASAKAQEAAQFLA